MPHRDETSREAIRLAREAGREALREARESAREQTRQARQTLRETVRSNRLALRESARPARRGGAGGEADTRTRIQQVALELFTENGYDATSLREIAEELGVTKAALYYHFRSKDEIVESLIQDQRVRVTELIEWASDQPPTAELRREFLRRYSELLHEGGHHQLMRFMERNQSWMNHHKAGAAMRDTMRQMLDILSDRNAPLADQIRSSMAIFALHASWFVVRDPEVTDAERRAAALEVALGMVSP